MTTAFELGCLSAMEKVADSLPNFPQPSEQAKGNYGQLLRRIRQNRPHPPMVNLDSNSRGQARNPSYGDGSEYTGVPFVSPQETVARNNEMFGSPTSPGFAAAALEPAPTPAASKTPTKYLSGNKIKMPDLASVFDMDASKKRLADLITNLQDPKNLGALASTAARTPLNPFYGITNPVGGALVNALAAEGKESLNRPEPKPQQGGLMSHLKNPYVLGGLGAAGLGLGGYAAYKAYQGSKKKKKPASE
jgi:hypothetical protein